MTRSMAGASRGLFTLGVVLLILSLLAVPAGSALAEDPEEGGGTAPGASCADYQYQCNSGIPPGQDTENECLARGCNGIGCRCKWNAETECRCRFT